MILAHFTVEIYYKPVGANWGQACVIDRQQFDMNVELDWTEKDLLHRVTMEPDLKVFHINCGNKCIFEPHRWESHSLPISTGVAAGQEPRISISVLKSRTEKKGFFRKLFK